MTGTWDQLALRVAALIVEASLARPPAAGIGGFELDPTALTATSAADLSAADLRDSRPSEDDGPDSHEHDWHQAVAEPPDAGHGPEM